MMTMTDAVLRKCRERFNGKEQLFRAEGERIIALCEDIAKTFCRGPMVYVMGNGGSACDAQHLKRWALPAMALGTDTALLTAIGNDTDLPRIFSDQIRVLGRPGSMALGISTSDHSPNVLHAYKWSAGVAC